MIDMLKSIGIEKGKKFDPDPKTQTHSERSHRRSARLARQPLRSGLLDLLQRGKAVGASSLAGSWRRNDDQLREAGFLSGRRTRRRLFDGLLQRQASRHRAVLPDDDPRQGPQTARGRRQLSAQRAGERARQTLLVGDGLRPRHARADPRPANVRAASSHDVRACRRTPTVRSTSISARRRRQARNRTGCRRTRTESSRCCFASTGPRSRSSTRRGCCRTSRRSPRNEQMGASNEVSCFCSSTAGGALTLLTRRTRFPSPSTTSFVPSLTCILRHPERQRRDRQSFCTAANRRRSTIRP